MAKGILMERHDLDPVQAFRMLVESSQATQMKLHQVATWLVEHRGSLA
jgi:AmiR/NasT family two-component response regulator